MSNEPDSPGVRFSFSPMTRLPSSTSNSVTFVASTFFTSKWTAPAVASSRFGQPSSVSLTVTVDLAHAAGTANAITRRTVAAAAAALTAAGLTRGPDRRGRSTTHIIGTAYSR